MLSKADLLKVIKETPEERQSTWIINHPRILGGWLVPFNTLEESDEFFKGFGKRHALNIETSPLLFTWVCSQLKHVKKNQSVTLVYLFNFEPKIPAEAIKELEDISLRLV